MGRSVLCRPLYQCENATYIPEVVGDGSDNNDDLVSVSSLLQVTGNPRKCQ